MPLPVGPEIFDWIVWLSIIFLIGAGFLIMMKWIIQNTLETTKANKKHSETYDGDISELIHEIKELKEEIKELKRELRE